MFMSSLIMLMSPHIISTSHWYCPCLPWPYTVSSAHICGSPYYVPDCRKIITKSGIWSFEEQKNKFQVPEDQETLQVHQKNIAHVLVHYIIPPSPWYMVFYIICVHSAEDPAIPPLIGKMCIGLNKNTIIKKIYIHFSFILMISWCWRDIIFQNWDNPTNIREMDVMCHVSKALGRRH